MQIWVNCQSLLIGASHFKLNNSFIGIYVFFAVYHNINVVFRRKVLSLQAIWLADHRVALGDHSAGEE